MGVILDLDGTLINSLNFHAKYIKRALDKIGIGKSIPYSFVRSNIRVSFSAFCRILSKKYGIKIDEKLMKEIIETKDKMISKDEIEKIQFFKNAKELIDFLKEKRVKMCIASSINNFELRLIRKKLKLNEIGIPIINSKQFKYEKPNPYIINESIRRYNMNPKRTCYIGDSIMDYAATKNAGIKFIGVYNNELSKKGLFFRNLTDLYKYFKSNYQLYYDS